MLSLMSLLIACGSHDNNKSHNETISGHCEDNIDSLSIQSSDTLNKTILNRIKSKEYECAYYLASNRNHDDFNSLLVNTLAFIDVDSLNEAKGELNSLNDIELVECSSQIKSFFYKLIVYDDQNIHSRRNFIDVFIANHYSENPNEMCVVFTNNNIEEAHGVEIEGD